MMLEDDNGWPEHKMFVTTELKRLNRKVDDLNNLMVEVKIQLATLKVRSSMRAGVLGALTGSIPGVIAVLWFLTKGG